MGTLFEAATLPFPLFVSLLRGRLLKERFAPQRTNSFFKTRHHFGGFLSPGKHIPYLFGYKTGLSLSRMSTNNQISPTQFAVIRVLPFLNNPKDLDLSYKTDLDFWDCFGRKKTPSSNRRNTVRSHKS